MDAELTLPGEATLPEAMRLVGDLYALIDVETRRFAAETGVGCPPGCGQCCEGPSPDISRTEAEYLARFLLVSESPAVDVALARYSTASPCPFYDTAGDLHCSVYWARPLICRAFGFTGSRDREGRIRYRLCRTMVPPAGFDSVGSCFVPADIAAYRSMMPTICDGSMLEPLDLAVAGALRTLLLRRHLWAAEQFADRCRTGAAGSDDEHDPERPKREPPPAIA